MGSVFLTSGMGVSVVTGIDDHSRFCVIAKVVARATARPVCDALLEALNGHGIPRLRHGIGAFSAEGTQRSGSTASIARQRVRARDPREAAL